MSTAKGETVTDDDWTASIDLGLLKIATRKALDHQTPLARAQFEDAIAMDAVDVRLDDNDPEWVILSALGNDFGRIHRSNLTNPTTSN
jgi:hypothetical protein